MKLYFPFIQKYLSLRTSNVHKASPFRKGPMVATTGRYETGFAKIVLLSNIWINVNCSTYNTSLAMQYRLYSWALWLSPYNKEAPRFHYSVYQFVHGVVERNSIKLASPPLGPSGCRRNWASGAKFCKTFFRHCLRSGLINKCSDSPYYLQSCQ